VAVRDALAREPFDEVSRLHAAGPRAQARGAWPRGHHSRLRIRAARRAGCRRSW
jgi:hypothetical protein